MAHLKADSPDLSLVAEYLKGAAKYLVRELYGPDGPPWGTTLTQLEDIVGAIQQTLARHFFALALDRQAKQLASTPEEIRQCPSCKQTLSCADSRTRTTQTRVGQASWDEPAGYCSRCRRDYFPQSRSLGIDQSGLSPGLLSKLVSVACRCRSFIEASDVFWDLTGIRISPKQIERIIHQIGQERADQRDAEVAQFEKLPLVEKFATPSGVTAPDLAVVMTDGGRLQIRSDPIPPESAPAVQPVGVESVVGEPVGDQPTPDTPLSVDPATVTLGATPTPKPSEESTTSGHWREDKVGLLMTMQSKPSDQDPCPVLPRTFVDPARIPKLARQIRTQAKQGEDAAAPATDPEADAEALTESGVYAPPEPDKRKVVASRMPWPRFAVLVAATAWALGFQGAKRKAFVGDGSDNNWEIHKRFFGSFTPILDFIHALSYVHAAATAGRDSSAGWRVYNRWIRLVWGGRVEDVIAELVVRQAELGQPDKSEPQTSPRQVVADSLRYLRNQAGKMKYPEYRQAGLPITSSLVESTVKQINHRVKGTEKFWTEEGAEAILQLRADQLSTDGTMPEFWKGRQAKATGQRPYRRSRKTQQAQARPAPLTRHKSNRKRIAGKKSRSV
jgi:hypothetical protein